MKKNQKPKSLFRKILKMVGIIFILVVLGLGGLYLYSDTPYFLRFKRFVTQDKRESFSFSDQFFTFNYPIEWKVKVSDWRESRQLSIRPIVYEGYDAEIYYNDTGLGPYSNYEPAKALVEQRKLMSEWSGLTRGTVYEEFKTTIDGDTAYGLVYSPPPLDYIPMGWKPMAIKIKELYFKHKDKYYKISCSAEFDVYNKVESICNLLITSFKFK